MTFLCILLACFEEKSIIDCVAKNKAFSVNGLHGHGNVREDIENDTEGNRLNVRENGGDDGAEHNLLNEGVHVEHREHGAGNSGGGGARAKGNEGICQGSSSGINGGRGELDHGG